MSRLVAFLGPSLPSAEARRVAGPVTLLPPAARGDVWRALASRPAAIALVDGVFEARPAVWHRELLEALEAGVAVFGAASMGALRACELAPFGMVGVGQVFRWFRDGQLVDDGEVALLHGDVGEAYLPLTVPLVNVRWIAKVARAQGILKAAEATALIGAAAGLFYQDRRWPKVLERVGWSTNTRRRFDRYAAAGLPNLKADDARTCLTAASTFVRDAPVGAVRQSARTAPVRVRLGVATPALATVGTDAVVLAAMARELGLEVSPSAIARARTALARMRGWRPARLDAELVRAGLNAAEAARLFEDLALAELVRRQAPLL